MKKFCLFFVVFIILSGKSVFAFWPWQKDYLAKVNEDSITLNDFKEKLGKFHTVKDIGKKMKADIPIVDYRSILEQMIVDRLMIQEAVRIGLNKTAEFVDKYNLEKLNYSLDMLRKEEIVDKVIISEDEIYERLKFLNETVRIRHLFTKDRTKGEKWLEDLREGSDFASLVEKESEDIEEIKQKGGDTGFKNRWGLPKKIAEVAFSMKEGEISDIIKMDNGFHVIKLEKKKIPSRKISERERKNIRKDIFKKKGKKRNKEYLTFLRENAKIDIHEEVLKSLSLETKSDTGEKVVATVNGKPIMGNEIILRLKISFRNKNKDGEDKIIKTILDRLIREKLLEMEVAKRNYEQDENLELFLKQTMEPFLLEMFKRKILSGAVKLSEEELKKYYKDHEKDYKMPDKIRLRIIKVYMRDEAYSTLEELTKGADFGVLADEISKDKKTSVKKGDTGWILSNELPPNLEKSLDEMKIGGIYGPYDTSPGYLIMKLEGREKGSVKEFEKVKDTIINELGRKKYDEISDEYIKKLRSFSTIKINGSLLKSYIKSKKRING